jgi:lipopolysaccharide transport system ATP-binding protein
MSDLAIRVQDLSKAYRIGVKELRKDTLGETVLSWLKSPVRNFNYLKNLSMIDPLTDDPDVHWALKDINVEIKQGEVLGIIGKNGAGKSTLLKIISQITYPTKGTVEIYGRVASLLEVGTGFNPELTGRENVYLNGTILGMRRREIDFKFDEIVDFSGVEKFIDTPVKRYSSGMKVRLAFAVAAHLEPEILIVDEVLAVGDTEFQRKCLGKMHDVSEKEGRTVLFVSHNLSMIQSLCETGLLLVNGMARSYDKIQSILELYKKELFSEAINGDTLRDNFAVTELHINEKNSDYTIEEDKDLDIRIEFFSKIDCLGSIYFIVQNEEGYNVVHTRRDNEKFVQGSNRFHIRYPTLPIKPGLYSFNVKIIYNNDGIVDRFISNMYYINFVATHNLADLNALLTPKYNFDRH